MKKLLISNIGNRNLKYRGDFIDKDTFRSKTRELLENYEQEREHLLLNILDVLLNQKKDEIERVILFASNQEGVHNHQDTVYEAGIMGRKIKEIYGLPTEVKELKCSVVDNNALLQRFRNMLKGIIRTYPDSDFILCDSGGTAQQKSSLKIITEYLLPEDKFRFYHITEQKGGPSKITEVNQREYRRVIDAEQMIRLIEEGNYQGALSIHRLNSSEKGQDRKVEKLLQFAASRKAHLLNETIKYAGPQGWKPYEQEKFDFLVAYSKHVAVAQNYASFADFIKEEDFFYISELLSIAEYAYLLRDYNQSLLYYQIFVESYLYAVLKLKGYDLTGNDYEKQMDRLVPAINQDASLKAEFARRGLRPDRKGVPTLGLVCQHWEEDETHQQMMQSIFKINSKLHGRHKDIPGLDGLRNSYAHKGNGINTGKIMESIPGWEQIRSSWHRSLGMPDQNIFVQMNKAIIDYMK